MRHYNNILYVNYGSSNETDGLKQALSLARNNAAPLKILVLIPKFPDGLLNYKENFEQYIHQKILNSVANTQTLLKMEKNTVAVSIELLTDQAGGVVVIKQVLQYGYDLVIKEAEPRDGNGGFKAVDMDLLRKCPVPVWLCRPIAQSHNDIQVAVAIDPESTEPSAKRLSTRLLQMSDSLATKCNQQLQIVSCWDYELESTLKNNVLIKVPTQHIDQKVEEAQQSHHKALIELVENAKIENQYIIHHLRGKPADIIPDLVNQHDIDILVMGTIARTGIAGFMIGNTAENIIQKISCSLLALKPHGFISPIKI